jgi:hypothetical protein
MHQEKKLSRITIGKAVFKNVNEKTKEIIEKYEEIKSTLNKDEWVISKFGLIHFRFRTLLKI